MSVELIVTAFFIVIWSVFLVLFSAMGIDAFRFAAMKALNKLNTWVQCNKYKYYIICLLTGCLTGLAIAHLLK